MHNRTFSAVKLVIAQLGKETPRARPQTTRIENCREFVSPQIILKWMLQFFLVPKSSGSGLLYIKKQYLPKPNSITQQCLLVPKVGAFGKKLSIKLFFSQK